MTNEITRPGPSLAEADVAACEGRLGRPIPPAYREFLLRHNGGRPERDGFEVESNGSFESGYCVRRFLGVSHTERTFTLEWVADASKGDVPDEFFPIAVDPGGNMIGLIVGGERDGQVFFWDHEMPADTTADVGSREDMFFVAASFAEFFDKLKAE